MRSEILMTSGVLVVGAGGLGCPVLWALGPELAQRGVAVTVVDDDVVDLSNLHRQILYRAADVGRPKVEALAEVAARRWPRLQLDARRVRIDASNVDSFVRGRAVVVDGTDGAATKFLLNDACVAAGAPLVHGGVVGWRGQLSSITNTGACLRCLFEGPPDEEGAPSCAADGVIGPVAGIVGAKMAAEALAIVDGRTPRLRSAIEVIDCRGDGGPRVRVVRIRRRADCAICSTAAQGAFA
jgi:molybdopterin/thiamine biosynthesis adenylyltransferase